MAVDIFVIDIFAVYGLIMIIDFVWDNWLKGGENYAKKIKEICCVRR